MITLTFANQKGGVGKSTSSICVAQELIRKGFKVLFIDSDPQCNATNLYRAKTRDEYTLMDLLCGDEAQASDCVQHTEYGDIIPGDPEMKNLDMLIYVKMDPNERNITEKASAHLSSTFSSLDSLGYDFCVIDTPPSLGVALMNALAVTDYIIVPYDEGGWSLDGFMDLYSSIKAAERWNKKLKILGILSTGTKKTKLAAKLESGAKMLAAKAETNFFHTKIRSSAKCTEALTEKGIPLHLYAPTSTTEQDYEALTAEILEKLNLR